jgi:hypothetical protein
MTNDCTPIDGTKYDLIGNSRGFTMDVNKFLMSAIVDIVDKRTGEVVGTLVVGKAISEWANEVIEKHESSDAHQS